MSSPLSLRLLLADNHPLVREGLSTFLSRHADFQIVAQAANGAEAVRLYRSHQPDLVIMDVLMPEMDGIEATRAILLEWPDARIILFSASTAEEYVYQAHSTGARAYLSKGSEGKDLLAAIREVLAGKIYLSEVGASRLTQRLQRLELTPRELEMLGYIARGMSNAQIGAHCYISEGTVKSHVNRLLMKRRVRDRTGAAMAALQRGLIRLEEMPAAKEQ